MRFVFGTAEPGHVLGDASGGTTIPAPMASPSHKPSRLQQVLPKFRREAWGSFPPACHPPGRKWARSSVKESPTGCMGCLTTAVGQTVTWPGWGNNTRQDRQDSQLLVGRSAFTLTDLTVLVCRGHHNKTPQAGWLQL